MQIKISNDSHFFVITNMTQNLFHRCQEYHLNILIINLYPIQGQLFHEDFLRYFLS